MAKKNNDGIDRALLDRLIAEQGTLRMMRRLNDRARCSGPVAAPVGLAPPLTIL